MTAKPRVWVSRPTFPDIVARLDPYFDVVAEPREIMFSPAELAAKIADCNAVIVGL
jgi:gluconate 2-dehydrogenase